ncbi:MAG TPA: methyltransferase [Flavisolibacter sp.]|nr:methyltransferase [Flavisolibacter sp.]
MPNAYFRFKQFTVFQDRSAMKVTTDACLFGAWCASEIQHLNFKAGNLLDIGTGTGLLSLMVAQKNNIATDAVEIDKDAARQAAENIGSSRWNEKITVHEQDILSFHSRKKYDCVISNPPFYENELPSQKKEKNIAHHSFHLTLSQLFPYIKNVLNDQGTYFLLLPFKRIAEIESQLTRHELFVHKKLVVQQSTLHAPFRILVSGGQTQILPVRVSAISIWDEKQQYTPEFTALLRDYYLYL